MGNESHFSADQKAHGSRRRDIAFLTVKNTKAAFFAREPNEALRFTGPTSQPGTPIPILARPNPTNRSSSAETHFVSK